MPLTTLQGLLVLSAVVWAIFPIYGAPVFLALDALLLLTAAAKSRAAAKYVAAQAEQLDKTMTPEAKAWVQRFAFHFVWPAEAKAYGTALKMTSLVMMMLGVWFVVYSLLRWNPTLLFALVPAAVVFFLGTTVGGKLEPDLLLTEDRYKDKQPLHEEAVKVLSLLSTAGRWAPPSAP